MAVVKHERMTPAVRRGYLAPYNSWANRIATLRFVQDIPLEPSHPSYRTLTEVEEGLSQFQQAPMHFDLGDERLVLHAGVFAGISKAIPPGGNHGL